MSAEDNSRASKIETTNGLAEMARPLSACLSTGASVQGYSARPRDHSSSPILRCQPFNAC